MEVEKQEFELIADLMESSMTQTQEVTNRVMENLEEQALRAEATLELVIERVERLFDGDYMPTPAAIFRALQPSNFNIETRMNVKRRTQHF